MRPRPLPCPRGAPPRGRPNKKAMAEVERLIQAMDPVRREALLLHRIDGLTYTEIGQRLSLPRLEVTEIIAEAVAELAGGLAAKGLLRDK